MKSADFIKAHDRVKDFDWTPSYRPTAARYTMPYRIPKKTSDPFRHLVRDYCSMERDKDDRQYGAMSDVMARAKMPAKAEDRWTEVLKIVLPVTCYAEYAAMKCTGQLVDAVDNAELRQGYLAQMIDEVRHVNQEAHLARYLAKHGNDPEGFERSFKLRSTNFIMRAGRACFDGFFAGNPIEGAMNLQVVAETAYTNPLFVTLTEVAAANGDQATPTTFLSVQSDEARHMANGYATLAAIASVPDNIPRLQRDFDTAFWRQHCFLDTFIAAVYDAGTDARGGGDRARSDARDPPIRQCVLAALLRRPAHYQRRDRPCGWRYGSDVEAGARRRGRSRRRGGARVCLAAHQPAGAAGRRHALCDFRHRRSPVARRDLRRLARGLDAAHRRRVDGAARQRLARAPARRGGAVPEAGPNRPHHPAGA